MTKKEEKMFGLVETWRKSGKKRKEFCDDHHLKVSTFSYWITRKNKASQPGESKGFLPIDMTGFSSGQVEMIFPNGIKLILPADDPRLIANLIKVY